MTPRLLFAEKQYLGLYLPIRPLLEISIFASY